MKEILDRKFIEGLSSSDNKEFVDQMQNNIINLVALSIEDLSSRVPFVSIENVVLQPVNETFNGALTPMSEYVYFLGINSPQMELNCKNYTGSAKKFKEKFVKAWYDSKRKKSKKRKRKEEGQNHTFVEFEPEKYNLDSFRRDLQLCIVKNLSVTSIVYNTNDRLIIQGKDDFGSVSRVIIIPVIYDGDNFKYFINKRKGFIDINMEERLINFNIKYEMVGDNFFTILKLFNNLFRTITKQSVNQIFVESLLYNVPNELFKGSDIYQIFVNIINYLNMVNINDFISIENKSQKIFNSKLTNDSLTSFNKFMKNI